MSVELDEARSTSGETVQELRDFSFIVAHDLSAVFRQLEQFAQLLAAPDGAESIGEQQMHAEHVRATAATCRSMMDELLVFSRAHHTPLKLANHDATQLMELAVLQLREEVAAAGAEIDIGVLGSQYVDGDLVVLAFKAALCNAIKFRKPDLAPKVSVRRVTEREDWTIRIADNGLGVALKRQEKMFSMFYRDDPARGLPGVGAGLAICRRIMRRHGGDVRFVEAEAGACIEMSLPRFGGRKLAWAF